jgi:DNA-binding transcriptional LysR family regulator
MIELDLNLLRVFDALIELRSVTRAADRLGLTQSAISHALGRLRRALDDPLFLRGPSGLQASARAEEIAPGIREGLLQLRSALAPPEFDPATATRRFAIAGGTYFCVLLIPTLVERLRREAPGVSLRIVPAAEGIAGLLDRGTIDLALGGTVEVPARFVVENLYDEEMVWIASAANPIVQRPFDAAHLAKQPRVIIALHKPLEASYSMAETSHQLFVGGHPDWETQTGSPVLTVFDSQAAVAAVARSDLVAMIPRRMAEHGRRQEPIALLGVATDDNSMTLAMLWHSKQRADAGLAWLRGLIQEVAAAG